MQVANGVSELQGFARGLRVGATKETSTFVEVWRQVDERLDLPDKFRACASAVMRVLDTISGAVHDL